MSELQQQETMPDPNAPPRDTPWVVYSHEHKAWWRPNSAGYSLELIGAGLYSRDEAKEIQRRANGPSTRRNEEAMSLGQALAEERAKFDRPGTIVFDVLRESLAERDEARSSLRLAEARLAAHELGWTYYDEDGTWREDADNGAKFVCLDEDLVSLIASMRAATSEPTNA